MISETAFTTTTSGFKIVLLLHITIHDKKASRLLHMV